VSEKCLSVEKEVLRVNFAIFVGLEGAQMTLFSPDAKISISHYRLVWRPTFILPFGLGAAFHITVWSETGFHISVPGGSRKKFGFSTDNFPIFD
jgi:hypothetical protein